MLCKGLHHAAYRCADARATVEFYTNVLGLEFVHAMGEDSVPSTGRFSPHIHVFFRMEDGSHIAFFEAPADAGEPSGRDAATPDWIQHFAFRVESMSALDAARDQLVARGMDVVGPTNHDDFLYSIYFFDPSGHRLELAYDASTDEQERVFRSEALPLLELWDQTHDWSRREEFYGSRRGYKRKPKAADPD